MYLRECGTIEMGLFYYSEMNKLENHLCICFVAMIILHCILTHNWNQFILCLILHCLWLGHFVRSFPIFYELALNEIWPKFSIWQRFHLLAIQNNFKCAHKVYQIKYNCRLQLVFYMILVVNGVVSKASAIYVACLV